MFSIYNLSYSTRTRFSFTWDSDFSIIFASDEKGWRTLRTLSRHLGSIALHRSRLVPGETSVHGWLASFGCGSSPYSSPFQRAAQGRCLNVQVFNHSYIIDCVLASKLLSWIRIISGLGIPVVPSFRTFRVNLGGYSAFSFLIPREEVLL